MRLPRRRALAIGLSVLVALSAALWALRSRFDPSYKGHTLTQWTACAVPDEDEGGAPFVATEKEVREALFVLGINHLKLLVRWISYDPEKSIFIPLFRALPRRVNMLPVFAPVADNETRRNRVTGEA